MKKIWYVFILAVILSGCEVGPQDVNARYFSENVPFGPDKDMKLPIATIDVNSALNDVPREIILRGVDKNEYHYVFSGEKKRMIK